MIHHTKFHENDLPHLRPIIEKSSKIKKNYPLPITLAALTALSLPSFIGFIQSHSQDNKSIFLAYFAAGLFISFIILFISKFFIKNDFATQTQELALAEYEGVMVYLQKSGLELSAIEIEKSIIQVIPIFFYKPTTFSILEKSIRFHCCYLLKVAAKIKQASSTQDIRDRLSLLKSEIEKLEQITQKKDKIESKNIELMHLQKQLDFLESLHSASLQITKELTKTFAEFKQIDPSEPDNKTSTRLLSLQLIKEKKIKKITCFLSLDK